jgi:outer membrane lipoprotein-sorting protein
VEPQPSHCDAEVLPRDAQAKKYVQVLRLRFDPENGQLYFFELVGKDGSSLKTEFSNVQINPKIAPSVFTFDLNGYRSDSEKQ